MTALELAEKQNPKVSPARIIWYGCPDQYGVGICPEWCVRDSGYEFDKALEIDQCWVCWQQDANRYSE